MCGRFSRSSPVDVILADFGVTSSAAVDFRPRYNVCPGEDVAAIVRRADGRRLGALRWGLPPRGQINVRSETLTRDPAFADTPVQHRCLIVADGFYEWSGDGPNRIPHFFRLRSQRPFAFVAIWRRASDADEEGRAGSAILTCPPNELVANVHDRMPVMLDASAAARWLEESDERRVAELLRPYPAAAMEAYPVSTLVNSSRNDVADCVRPAGGTLRLVAAPA
jgi:putative SOS response-associated peptidase YedK